MLRVIVLLGLLSTTFPSYAQDVEIWACAFTTRSDELIAGHGASIFKVNGSGLVGPLLSQEKVGYELRFDYSNQVAHGALSSKTSPDKSVTLRGVVKYSSEGADCLVEIIFLEGVHNIVLERLDEHRCEA
jgi:hypothetical protein